MTEFESKYKTRLLRLSTTNIADALDALELKGATCGIRPMWENAAKITGYAVTLKLTAAGLTKSKTHLGVKAIETAASGDVIVVDNGGRLDTSCWGGILANGARMKGVSGIVVDGAIRDLDDIIVANLPVYAKGTVVATARGRIMEESTNSMIQFGGVQVRPKDVILADKSGVVIIPQEKLEAVLSKAEDFFVKEEAMVAEILAGKSMLEVDAKYNYEKMLQK
ncbi:MAG: RraA family protein [Desulfovibrio sp.]|jgi:regulator of RNase E activity RraA|nr:RraA family protein [Desulfovibrio sp.]